jgi:hypothetical protein
MSNSNAIGSTRFILSNLALRVVHRHRAASRSATPCNSGQHLAFASRPIPTCINPPRRSTHAFSFKASIGQYCPAGGVGGLGVGAGGVGVGYGAGGVGVGVGYGAGGVGVGVGYGAGGVGVGVG